jgi:hypothetical protein
MKFKVVWTGLVVFALFAGIANAQTPNTTSTGRRWTVVRIADPVMVGREILMGTYLIIHDEAKMAKGEPCTTIYRFDPKTGPKEQVVAFMCLPHRGVASATNTLTVRSGNGWLDVGVLQAYGFAGDDEKHGVPADR